MFLLQLQNLPRKKSNLRELVVSGADFLKKHGIEQPRRNAEILLSHVLQKPLYHIYTSHDGALSADEMKSYAEMLKERAVRIPLQYITGKVDFHRYAFRIKKGVFIPRPETEILVEEAVNLYKKHFAPLFVNMLDIGTGSGNIAVTLAKEIPNCSVTAVDVSLRALDAACRNAYSIGVLKKIRFERANLFPPRGGKFHIIVSNPPYISRNDIASLDEEIRKALDGGDDGLKVIRQILKRADKFIHAGGFLVMEIGCGQADFIRNADCGLNLRAITKDLAGIERVAVFRKSPLHASHPMGED